MNPFDVLGLTGAAPTRAEVRRAYAALLRLHRPDDDPAGFRRVRDAYEALAGLGDAELAQFAVRAGRDGDDATAPAPEGPDADDRTPFDRTGGADAPWPAARPTAASPPAAPSRPEAEPAALGTFEANLRARLGAATSAAERIEILRGVMPLAEHDPALARATARIVAATDSSEGRTLAAAATPTFAMTLLASGDEAAVVDLAARWNRPEHWPHLIEWAQQADDHVPPVAALASPEALTSLALAVAVLLPHTAYRLVDEAFLHAPTDRRTALPLDDVDRWAAASIALGDDQRAARRGLALWAIGVTASADDQPSEDLGALEAVLDMALESIDRRIATEDDERLVDALDAVASERVDLAEAQLDARAAQAPEADAAPRRRARRPSLLLSIAAAMTTAVVLWTLAMIAGLTPSRASGVVAPRERRTPHEPTSPREPLRRSSPGPSVPREALPPGWKPLTAEEAQELDALRRLPVPITDEALRRRRDDLEYRASFMSPR